VEPVQPEGVGRAYYRAHTYLDVLAVLDGPFEADPSDRGSAVEAAKTRAYWAFDDKDPDRFRPGSSCTTVPVLLV
jgi:hypothetical protein